MPLMTPREAMEAALFDDPDDVVRHAAYADMLIEDGDPRGDFIRIQLQLEDLKLPAVGHRISAEQNFGGFHPF